MREIEVVGLSLGNNFQNHASTSIMSSTKCFFVLVTSQIVKDVHS